MKERWIKVMYGLSSNRKLKNKETEEISDLAKKIVKNTYLIVDNKGFGGDSIFMNQELINITGNEFPRDYPQYKNMHLEGLKGRIKSISVPKKFAAWGNNKEEVANAKKNAKTSIFIKFQNYSPVDFKHDIRLLIKLGTKYFPNLMASRYTDPQRGLNPLVDNGFSWNEYKVYPTDIDKEPAIYEMFGYLNISYKLEDWVEYYKSNPNDELLGEDTKKTIESFLARNRENFLSSKSKLFREWMKRTDKILNGTINIDVTTNHNVTPAPDTKIKTNMKNRKDVSTGETNEMANVNAVGRFINFFNPDKCKTCGGKGYITEKIYVVDPKRFPHGMPLHGNPPTYVSKEPIPWQNVKKRCPACKGTGIRKAK